ncbi:septum formation family protein [Cellulomonas sp. ATA003]|uniref:septum formation family protein n=1 Tax=Cellulomonas sp. ATA003 TaxID=3073064 RepID=UPI002873D78A|nr:septum formation family protein [Cellulomonas sp. ATA003]WNB85714.1 septum formation family protein [Cellulomonas sp. ATA003]
MSRSTRRPVATAGALVATALLLTGCSALQGAMGGVEPERDEATGEITEAAQADAFALRVGDCLTLEAEVTEELQEFASVPTVPCEEAHDSEIYAAHDLEGDEYPGDDAVVASADELCLADFTTFVGTPYEESVLELTTFFPSSDSWSMQDDREVLCVVVDVEGGVTGTLQGAQY